ncbi:unnamed protein product [Caenorhabditis angaria]|uniref:DUF38 domain-containing protein n=1 Tax=Caenorhabditis angaria TaxID=860376 RepID=A0A9P1MW27_9PELO|nr:unnamed protein product [Caenorhabditis angaria]
MEKYFLLIFLAICFSNCVFAENVSDITTPSKEYAKKVMKDVLVSLGKLNIDEFANLLNEDVFTFQTCSIPNIVPYEPFLNIVSKNFIGLGKKLDFDVYRASVINTRFKFDVLLKGASKQPIDLHVTIIRDITASKGFQVISIKNNACF